MRKKEITVQRVDHPMREVVQAMEPEAARLLTEKGGKVTRYDLHGMYYWTGMYASTGMPSLAGCLEDGCRPL